MAYEYESKLYANSVVHSMTGNVFIETGETKEIKEVYRKAKAFDELVELCPQKDEIPSDEFFDEMERIIKEDE
ncbi:hypothetical protein A4A29_09690 [Staphylococcus equorum]|uniref:DUF1024 family protein n=1 Tax=Staphylococcus equorum TaxID=246432 RepID=UPI0008FBB020|nr:DUF1024 family protein [Staphylococcus equorum]OIS52054.1 hypothetical protein A4A29_09690 [Staphylococcus equorum]